MKNLQMTVGRIVLDYIVLILPSPHPDCMLKLNKLYDFTFQLEVVQILKK